MEENPAANSSGAATVGANNAGRPIRLNVGGAIFATSLSTLMRFPDSMLGRMFGGDIPTAKDETGAVFIDRDGEMFRHVLNFLRDGDLLLPDSFDDFLRLQREADFFCLDALKEAAAVAETRKQALAFGAEKNSFVGRRFDGGHFVRIADDEYSPEMIYSLGSECIIRGSPRFVQNFSRCVSNNDVGSDWVVMQVGFALVEKAFADAGCILLQCCVWSTRPTRNCRESCWFVPDEAFEKFSRVLA